MPKKVGGWTGPEIFRLLDQWDFYSDNGPGLANDAFHELAKNFGDYVSAMNSPLLSAGWKSESETELIRHQVLEALAALMNELIRLRRESR